MLAKSECCVLCGVVLQAGVSSVVWCKIFTSIAGSSKKVLAGTGQVQWE